MMTVIGQNSDGLVSAPSFYEWLEKKGIKFFKKIKDEQPSKSNSRCYLHWSGRRLRAERLQWLHWSRPCLGCCDLTWHLGSGEPLLQIRAKCWIHQCPVEMEHSPGGGGGGAGRGGGRRDEALIGTNTSPAGVSSHSQSASAGKKKDKCFD